jgi:hypothetical protein
MKGQRSASAIVNVPLEKITVINPRARNRKVFEGIVRNIEHLGLKRPITIIRKANGADGTSSRASSLSFMIRTVTPNTSRAALGQCHSKLAEG